MIAVSNSTPMIALSKIGRLDLLRDYFVSLIPEGSTMGGQAWRESAGAAGVASYNWIKVENVMNESLSDLSNVG
jgi:predicted nucleic acid-binding protein